MQGIIYVAHGSQKVGKNRKMLQFCESLKGSRTEENQAVAFLEKHADSLPVVAEKMINQGVNHLLIVPLLLFSAKHKEEDIPNNLEGIIRKYPRVSLTICSTFAQEPEVVALLLARIKQSMIEYQLSDESQILLVAHGSSTYQEPAAVVSQIDQQLAAASNLKVSTGLLYGSDLYQEKARELLATGQALLIVPFFLFDGHLVDKIKKEGVALSLERDEHPEIYYAETLNLDQKIIPSIVRLMNEAEQDG